MLSKIVCLPISEKRSFSILGTPRSDNRSCAIVDRRYDFMSFSLELLLSLVATVTDKVRKIQYHVTKSGKQVVRVFLFRMPFGFSSVRMKFSAHALNATINLNKSVDASLLYFCVNFVTLIAKSLCERLHILAGRRE